MPRLLFVKSLCLGAAIGLLPAPVTAQTTLEGCLKQVRMSNATACIVKGDSRPLPPASEPDVPVADESMTLSNDPDTLETERRIWEARYEMALRRIHSPYERPEEIESFLDAKEAFDNELELPCAAPDCHTEKIRRYIYALQEKYNLIPAG
jgi:hypothetical protein